MVTNNPFHRPTGTGPSYSSESNGEHSITTLSRATSCTFLGGSCTNSR